MFSGEYREIFRCTFFVEQLRWLPQAKLESSLWNSQIFGSSYFWLDLISWASSALWHSSCETRCPQKNVCGGIHLYCNSNFKIFKIKTVSSAMYSKVDVFLHSQSGWCFEIVFLNDLSIKNTFLFNFFQKKIVRQFDVRSHVIQNLADANKISASRI